MYLRKQGPGTVTAGDIVPPAGVTVHNPDLHIATLNDKGRLEVELVVERGRGYVPAAQNKASGAEIGRIPVDSIYSPVLKVTYKVEATRVEQRTDFDKLILDVETKPSITPRDALASAGTTLVELFGLARELNVDAEGIEIGPSPAEADSIAAFAMPIEELDLTVRSYNCLKREGIHTVGELVGRTRGRPAGHPQLRAKSIDEVKMKLAGLGLALKDSPPGFDPSAAAADYPSRASSPTAPTAASAATGLRRTTARTTPRPSSSGTTPTLTFCPLPGPGRPEGVTRQEQTCPSPPRARGSGVPAHQKLMLANLATSLFTHGRIHTTRAKADRLRPYAERLITKAKKGDLHLTP